MTFFPETCSSNPLKPKMILFLELALGYQDSKTAWRLPEGQHLLKTLIIEYNIDALEFGIW